MSSKKQLDALGERMKTYERLHTNSKFIPNLPLYIRLDGRSFSNFTRKMKRPYDERMSTLMIETTKFLVKELNATVGYTQSDEISLVLNHAYTSPAIFEGKVQKIISTAAALASAFFISRFEQIFGEPYYEYSLNLPTFDCRAFELPNWGEVANAFLWRYLDAKKNSVQMLAQSLYSHQQLQNLHTDLVKSKMLAEKDVDWETYPEFFKTGVFIANQKFVKQLETSACLRSKVDILKLEKPFHLLSFEEQILVVKHSTREVLGWNLKGEITLGSGVNHGS